MEQVKDIVVRVMTDLSSGKPAIQKKITKLWSNISDKKTIAHTAVVGLDKGSLIICADSPAWLFQLNLQKTKILKSLQKEIPDIINIRFKIGKVK